MKKIIMLLACVLTVGILGGCTSDKDVSSYLQALLDTSYKNDTTAFVKMGLGTEEDASTLYEQGIDNGTEAFCGRLGVTDEFKQDFRTLYKDMLSKVRYEVGKAEKQSDGSYQVVVSYEKMNVFQPATAMYQEKVAELAKEWTEGDAPSEEEMMHQIVLTYRESLEAVLAEVKYNEPQTMTVRIELVDNVYTPNTDDVAELEKALFDGE